MNIKNLKNYDIFFVFICLSFSLTGLLSYYQINAIVRLFIFPLLILYYFKDSRNIERYFLYFLVSFCFAEICHYLSTIYSTSFVITYFSNISFIMGYIFLVVLIISKLNIKRLVKRFPIQILILGAVGIYLFIELNSMVMSNRDILSIDSIISILYNIDSIINILYNLVIIVLLGFSLLNYFYHESPLSIKLLIACSILIFSEFVQTSLFFMASKELLSKVYIVLLAISYLVFFYYMKALKKS